MSNYQNRIEQLRQRISTIGSQLAGLADRRKSYSLAASDGDTTAIRQIADVDFEADALRKDAATLGSALETAEALEKQNALEAEQQQRREREIEARKCAEAVVAFNLEIDDALTHLRGMLERRASLLVGLGRTEVCDPSHIMKLSSKAGPTASAHKAGLGRFLALEMTPVAAQRPLADTNPLLLGVGRASSDAKPVRTKFRGDR